MYNDIEFGVNYFFAAFPTVWSGWAGLPQQARKILFINRIRLDFAPGKPAPLEPSAGIYPRLLRRNEPTRSISPLPACPNAVRPDREKWAPPLSLVRLLRLVRLVRSGPARLLGLGSSARARRELGFGSASEWGQREWGSRVNAFSGSGPILGAR